MGDPQLVPHDMYTSYVCKAAGMRVRVSVRVVILSSPNHSKGGGLWRVSELMYLGQDAKLNIVFSVTKFYLSCSTLMANHLCSVTNITCNPNIIYYSL